MSLSRIPLADIGPRAAPTRWNIGFSMRIVDMTEGGSYTIPAGAGHIVFKAAADIAAFTVNMPTAPIGGEIRRLSFGRPVASLAISATQPVDMIPASVNAGDQCAWVFIRETLSWLAIGIPSAGGGGGVTDHGELTGRADDDHTQYHTDARGDARYSALGHGHDYAATGHTHAGVYQPAATVLTNTTAAFTTGQESKLAGIATGATVNSADAVLQARASHTGTQAAATISDFDTQVRTSRLDQMAAPSASVSFGAQQVLSFRLENRTSDPGSPAAGQLWLRTDL
jgi:hypothetical protein